MGPKAGWGGSSRGLGSQVTDASTGLGSRQAGVACLGSVTVIASRRLLFFGSGISRVQKTQQD